MPTGHSLTDDWIPEMGCPIGRTPKLKFLRWQQGLNLVLVDDVFGIRGCEWDFYSAAGSVSDEHGTGYEWRLDTPDGRTATFRINNKEYDLSKGALFVIKANEDKVDIHQLSRDLAALPFDTGTLKAFLINDAEVRKLFGKDHAAKEQ
jgi:hypothetical protein